ncbi:MAG: IS1 family transposase [Bacteroidales bacterium]|nr:IS1 family transposase [Bacteroidales bacterium]
MPAPQFNISPRFARKTICFSKNEQIHDNVIGMYIERYYYKTETYGNN